MKMSKRKQSSQIVNSVSSSLITEPLLKKWRAEFSASPRNVVARNSVVTVGREYAGTNSDVARDITHVFQCTLKKHHLKATNQGSSGRCWLFAGMNMFRHFIIRELNLTDFEFSETYLYFWDRLERVTYFLKWASESQHLLEKSPCDSSREVVHMFEERSSDGGFWGRFANLAKKYGFIPKTAMPETFHSGDTDDINDVIINLTDAYVPYLRQNNWSKDACSLETRMKIAQQVYNVLVKFLGTPPQTFTWFFTNWDENTGKHRGNRTDLTVEKFTGMIFGNGGMNLDDFFLLYNLPTGKYEKKHETHFTSCMVGGKNEQFLNLEINYLLQYTTASILAGVPVWIACDVRKSFSPAYSALNTSLLTDDSLFGPPISRLTKRDKLEFGSSGATHAMVLIGVNVDKDGNAVSFQVENSWGFYDETEENMDGYLTMSKEWFLEYVFEVVIHKQILSRAHFRIASGESEIFNYPWETVFSSIDGKNARMRYMNRK